MAIGRGHGNVVKLDAAANATEQQAAAAHVTPARKFGREEQALAENCEQRLDIFRGGNAAQQNDFTSRVETIGEQACASRSRGMR